MGFSSARSLIRFNVAATVGLMASMLTVAAAAHDPEHAGALDIPDDWVYENGVGPDLDGDGNPATDAFAFLHIGNPKLAAKDPVYTVITFEPPPGGNGQAIQTVYESKYGVTFSPGLAQQICRGQRYIQYDSTCTYIAPPSGDYAAVYRNDFDRPLKISFVKPICAAAVAIYPTGGEEGEVFEAAIQGYDANGGALGKETSRFEWTANAFRWRVMDAIRFPDANAARLEISVDSISRPGRNVRFLIDDFAYANNNCAVGS